jgi:hypothetical protein
MSRHTKILAAVNARAATVFNRVAVAEGSRGFQPTDNRKQKVIRRVATIEPEEST